MNNSNRIKINYHILIQILIKNIKLKSNNVKIYLFKSINGKIDIKLFKLVKINNYKILNNLWKVKENQC
jgi:hypothetical protein